MFTIWQPVASFTKEVNPWLTKRPLTTNGRLANRGLTSSVKEATDVINGLTDSFHHEQYFQGQHNSQHHRGRMMHICVSKIIIICSVNGLSPARRQAIIWTNAGIFLIGPLGINFSETLNQNQYIFIQVNALKMSSAKNCLFSLGLKELIWRWLAWFCK